jgi:PPOX class probable F420-dependent enzyme
MAQMDESPPMERAEDFLRLRKIVWLATVHPSGRPHIVPVWFLWHQHALYILSQPHAQKVKNLRANPKCSIAVDDSDNGHQPVAFDGTASLEQAMLDQELIDLLVEKYGDMLKAMNWTPEQWIEAYSQPIRVVPDKFLKIT